MFETLKVAGRDNRIGPGRTAAGTLEVFAVVGVESLAQYFACKVGLPHTWLAGGNKQQYIGGRSHTEA